MDFEKGCEECGIEDEMIYNTITNNKPMRPCNRCATANGSLIFEDEIRKQREKLEKKKQPTPPSQIEPIEGKKPTMNDLWTRYNKIKEKRTQEAKAKEAERQRMVVFEEKKFVEDLETAKQKEKIDLIQEINKDVLPEANENEVAIADSSIDFSISATKKIGVKDFFKKTLKFLKMKNKEKSEEKDENKEINQEKEIITNIEEKE